MCDYSMENVGLRINNEDFMSFQIFVFSRCEQYYILLKLIDFLYSSFQKLILKRLYTNLFSVDGVKHDDKAKYFNRS
jgi:hypothetical protein